MDFYRNPGKGVSLHFEIICNILKMITYLRNIRQYYRNLEMVCATIFAVHKRSYNLQKPLQFTSLLRRQHYLQRGNQVNKIFSKITNGESKSDVAVNLPEVCRTQVICAKKAGFITT